MKKRLFVLFITLLVLLTSGVSLSAKGNDSPHNKAGTLVEEIRIDPGTGEEIYVVGQIIDKSSGEIKYIEKGDLILTPYSKIDDETDEAIKNRLEEIKKELIDDKPNLIKLCPDLKEKLKEYETLNENNLVVAEIYDVSLLDKEAKELLKDKDNKLSFKMYVDFDEDTEFIVITKDENGLWKVVDDVKYVKSEYGNYLYFRLDSDGCLALLRRGENKMCSCWFCHHLCINGHCICWIFLVVAILELIYIIYLKKKEKEEDKEDNKKQEEKEDKKIEEKVEKTVKKTATKKTSTKKSATKKTSTKRK